jgi:hypothetical protein
MAMNSLRRCRAVAEALRRCASASLSASLGTDHTYLLFPPTVDGLFAPDPEIYR